MLPTAVKAASASISTSGSPETSCTRNWAASALAPQAVALDAGRQVVSSGCVPLVIEPQGNVSPRLSSVMALAKALQAFTCSYRSRSSRSNDWARSAVRLWKR